MAITKQAWQTIRNSTWMMLGLACLFVALILWAMQLKKSGVEEVKPTEVAQQTERPIQAEKVAFAQTLGSFDQEVPAIDLTQRSVSVGSHAPEFRGSKYVAENNKRWTLQLMKVTEEDVIRAYLDKQENRQNFRYLRLSDGKNPEQFVLLYGVYDNVKQAMQALEQADFGLPQSVKIAPEKMTTYARLVNDLGSDEVSSGSALRTVVLSKAAIPKATVPVATPVSPVQQLAGTTTTIKTTNADGEVNRVRTEKTQVTPPVDAKKSNIETNNSGTAIKSENNETQVRDPF